MSGLQATPQGRPSVPFDLSFFTSDVCDTLLGCVAPSSCHALHWGETGLRGARYHSCVCQERCCSGLHILIWAHSSLAATSSHGCPVQSWPPASCPILHVAELPREEVYSPAALLCCLQPCPMWTCLQYQGLICCAA